MAFRRLAPCFSWGWFHLRQAWTLRPATAVRRVAKVLCVAARHPIAFLRVVAALRGGGLAELISTQPHVLLKFTWPALSLDFSTAERARILAEHYRFIQRRFNADRLRRMTVCRELLWEKADDRARLKLFLSVSPATYCEGELSMLLNVNGADIYALSFTICSAGAVRAGDGDAIFVSRLQGFRDSGERVKLATIAVGDISPTLILMAALQGIATGLGIKHIVGVRASQQVCVLDGGPNEEFLSAYDAFWKSIQGRKMSSGHYYFTVPLPEKALELIKQNHRPRVKTRRRFRQLVAGDCKARIERLRVPIFAADQGSTRSSASSLR